MYVLRIHWWYHVFMARSRRKWRCIACLSHGNIKPKSRPNPSECIPFRHNATLVIKKQSPSSPRCRNHPNMHFACPARGRPDYGAWLSLTILRTAFSYATRSFLNKLYASACAGDSGLTSSRSIWMPRRICLMVMAGFQASSSLRIERQTVPDG